MFGLPSKEIYSRLRIKQKEAIEKVYNHPKGRYLFQLPGGYGKSKAAIGAYIAARSQGEVNRLLIIVPSLQQFTEWEECKYDFEWFGSDLLQFQDGGYWFSTTDVRKCDWALNRHQNNQCEVFILNTQSLDKSFKSGSSKSIVHELTEKGRWMVIAEEAHHLAADLSWGKAVAGLNHELMIGLTATPFRRSGKHIFSSILDDKDSSFMVQCSIEDALKEKAIRPIQVKTGKFLVEFIDKEVKPGNLDRNKYIFNLSELKAKLLENNMSLTEYEAKQDLRVLDQFVRPLFSEALDELDKRNIKHPGQHQMIVHAPSVLTAQTYCKWISLMYESGAADWVGTCGQRTEKENREIIKAFKNGKLKILIQVQMFGEGSDNVRASVGLWLSMVGPDNPTSHQAAVRHSRRNFAIPWDEDTAAIFAPEDAPALERLLSIQEACEFILNARKQEDQDSASESEQLSLIPLEELRKKESAHRAELLDLMNADDLRRTVEEIRSKYETAIPFTAQNIADKNGIPYRESVTIIREVMESDIDKLIAQKLNASIFQASQEQAWEEANQRNEMAVKRIARFIAKKHHPVAYETSTFNTIVGTIKGKLNSLVCRQFNTTRNSRTAKGDRKLATIEDLDIQYEYLCCLADQINNGFIPTDLML